MNLQTVPDLPHELCQFKNCPRLFYLKNCAQLYRLKNCPRLCCPKNCPSRTVPDEPDQPDWKCPDSSGWKRNLKKCPRTCFPTLVFSVFWRTVPAPVSPCSRHLKNCPPTCPGSIIYVR